jgi:hypothetical protein
MFDLLRNISFFSSTFIVLLFYLSADHLSSSDPLPTHILLSRFSSPLIHHTSVHTTLHFVTAVRVKWQHACHYIRGGRHLIFPLTTLKRLIAEKPRRKCSRSSSEDNRSPPPPPPPHTHTHTHARTRTHAHTHTHTHTHTQISEVSSRSHNSETIRISSRNSQ